MELNCATLPYSLFLCLAVCISMISPALAGCDPKISGSQVVRMCYDNEASGTAVYIDTTGARATDNSSGPLCVCNATVNNAKFISIKVDGQKLCGSQLKFSVAGQNVETTPEVCRMMESVVQIQKKDEVYMSLEKVKAPYQVDYCSRIAIERCSEGLYQCNETGKCVIACDNYPDCWSGDDEDSTYCASAVCTEGMTSCKDGMGCYGPSDMCDNVTKCSDGTDEKGCYQQVNTSETVNEADSDPIITIQCFESNRFSTTTTMSTTTTSTTTTSTTTTTTTSTTTTTPTTTTSSTTTPKTTIISKKSTTSESEVRNTTTPPKSEPTGTDATKSSTAALGENDNTDKDTPPIIGNEPDEGILSTLKKPHVIAGIVVAGVALIAGTVFIILAIRRKMKRSKSKNLNTDLWISDKGEKELEPLNQ